MTGCWKKWLRHQAQQDDIFLTACTPRRRLFSPVCSAVAERDGWGASPQWKSTSPRYPAPEATAARQRRAQQRRAGADVSHTLAAGHGGKLSWAQVWRRPMKDGATLDSKRISGMARAADGDLLKIAGPPPGQSWRSAAGWRAFDPVQFRRR
jgi:elongation factor G